MTVHSRFRRTPTRSIICLATTITCPWALALSFQYILDDDEKNIHNPFGGCWVGIKVKTYKIDDDGGCKYNNGDSDNGGVAHKTFVMVL